LQLVDDARELGLQRPDALVDDLVGIEAADCFDVIEEAARLGVEVECLIGIGRAAVEVDALFV
jgi:hypothetical protein